MSDSFRGSSGRKVMSRSSASELGSVSHLLVDARQRRIAAVVMGRGKKAQLVDWAQLSGFGPDAIMVVDEGALRPPGDDRERAAAEGKSRARRQAGAQRTGQRTRRDRRCDLRRRHRSVRGPAHR